MSTSYVPRNSSDSICTPSTNTVETENDQAPLLKYVTKLERIGKGCGIASCSKVTNANLLEMQRVVEEAELKVKQSLSWPVPLPSNVGSSSASASTVFGSDPKKRKRVSAVIEKAFNICAREQLGGETTRMFYTSGLSFHFVRNLHYVNAFKNACSNPIPGYLPPGYNSLRTTLLQKKKANIERLLNPIKDSWTVEGVSVCSDGWLDSQRRPLINIMAICEIGPMFLKAVNCEGEFKDKYFNANFFTDSIREIGSQNVVQVITDNVANCKAVELLVEAKFPHIFWTSCVVHTLNLA
ncbi:hypothetical protein Q3G72_024952 [Acer saccharum]|nr:hypothetical protein Q3G72_024952 [Acer saccharum]